MALVVESGIVRHPRLAPVPAIARSKDPNFLAGLHELEVNRQRHSAQFLFVVVVLITGLVAPPNYEIARCLNLN